MSEVCQLLPASNIYTSQHTTENSFFMLALSV